MVFPGQQPRETSRFRGGFPGRFRGGFTAEFCPVSGDFQGNFERFSSLLYIEDKTRASARKTAFAKTAFRRTATAHTAEVYAAWERPLQNGAVITRRQSAPPSAADGEAPRRQNAIGGRQDGGDGQLCRKPRRIVSCYFLGARYSAAERFT